ncbi:hypothetical protein [Quadrisphaera sp. DSM 44207]|uniref:hypothetical protein n=1 Tax=Quadrisphaera sp. DSM 44207 TaxID=1881057 RepID=UPI0008805FFE|nr:hypothetical protein [Quadrisphaera sp. DSM 44207]SDQ86599.1 hypothetical protein SAMN05428996_2950 [Quadrisphaera sp. DSM 44207]
MSGMSGAGGASRAEGSWQLVIRTPVGRQDVVLDLAQDEAGGLGGTARSKDETVSSERVHLDGDRLTWSQSITRPMRLRLDFEVVLDGDRLHGHSRAGRLPRSSVTGQRTSHPGA